MTRFGWLVLGGVVVAALAIALLLWGFARQSHPDLSEEGKSQPTNPADLSLYANGAFGFSLQYPSSALLTDDFASSSQAWRVTAVASGTPIVDIQLADSDLRIGASKEQRALATCGTATAAETPLDPATIGDTTWKVFAFDQLGTDNERHVTSYRTVHDGQCFVIETLVGVPSPAGAQPAQAPSDNVAAIVHTFTFAR